MLEVGDSKKEFMVCTDACQDSVGWLLMQEDKVIIDESRKLNDHEKRYYAYELQLTTLVHALKVWWHYLLGKRLMLMIDHNSLANFFKHPNLNACQAKWTALF